MYLVRDIESKNLLGVFAAGSIAGLLDQIDEHTDPFDYEYISIKFGGLMFGEGVSGKCLDEETSPRDDDEDEGDYSDFPTATMTNCLYQEIAFRKPSGWKKFTRKNLNDCYSSHA